MKRIAILVATTAGPVLIERITPEPAPQSMVCLHKQSDVLSISADYDDFVRPGSGVIMREFGPYEEGAFRLDVSARITSGQSWQLGVFAAHAIFKSDRAELSDLENADLILWLSGRVDYDLKIGSVEHMLEKVEASALMLASWIAKGTPIVFAAHTDNADFLAKHKPPAGITVEKLQTTHDLINLLELSSQPREKNELPHKNNFSFWVMAILALFAVLALFFFSQPEDEKQPPVLELSLTSDRGREPLYHFGDDLTLIARLTKQAWLHCFYKQVDGTVLQIYPNPKMPKTQHNKPFAKDIRHVLSAQGSTGFVIRLGPPKGSEQVICFATSQDVSARLPDALKGLVLGPLEPTMAPTLEQHFARFKDVEVAIDRLNITLKP